MKVCGVPRCPNLVDAQHPCPKHPPRPKNAPWSKDRNRWAQHNFRQAVLKRAAGHCERCGCASTQLEAHHIRPGYTPDCGIAVCPNCHRTIDSNAR